ncbi:HNH endonuclease [Plastoroseomonas hellenica]|uniref:HNH endonuclease n=1 Tax=Plastoroseomonas hellenica TaxID=2687306 RepID=UPI001BA59124|nr:HNH endonuclease [Plastoroseomonas hellenica]MBR0647755.1 HNH endonuclease [Plastoroseomonas hellenica]
MRLLPLPLSAHPSAWLAGSGAGGQPGADREPRRRAAFTAEPVLSGDPAMCRFCGVHTTARHEPFHLNGDHGDTRPENLVAACAWCHLCQHLDDAEAASAAMLIWLPEISQAALVTIVRGMLTVLAGHGEVRAASARSPRQPEVQTGVHRAMAALQARADLARKILGTARPAMLGAALLALEPTSYRERANLLDGIRLLPTDRLIRGGRDILPDLLRQWCPPGESRQKRTAA